MWNIFKRRRRRRLTMQRTPPQWLELLREDVPYFDTLGEAERHRFLIGIPAATHQVGAVTLQVGPDALEALLLV